MNESLISVIIPVYKTEKYLRQCLDSVFTQTYTNLEVILVDDGSPDRSGLICDEYAERHDHVKVIHKKNAGLGMARNTGLEHATGEYITFLDSDDFIDADLIEKLHAALRANRVDMCKSGFRRVTDEGVIQNGKPYVNEVFPGREAAERLLPRMIGSAPDKKDSVEMAACACLYNAAPIRNHQISFPSERELISEDLVFNTCYMQYADGACVIADIGYNYRINTASLTKSYRADRFDAVMRFYQHMRGLLSRLGYGMDVILRLDRITFVNIRRCIAQEKCAPSNGAMGSPIRRIRAICADARLQAIIKEYPVKKLGIKQRLFVYMLQYSLSLLLYLCALLNLF